MTLHDEIEKGEYIDLVFPEKVRLTGIEFMDPDHEFQFDPGEKYGRAAFDLLVDLTLVLDDFDIQRYVDLRNQPGLIGNSFRFKADHTVDRFYIRMVSFEPVNVVPVPEPSTLLFLGLGLAGLGFVRRYRHV